MLESLLILFLICFAAFFLVAALTILGIGWARKSAKLKKIALWTGVAPFIFLSLVLVWYAIAPPGANTSQMEDFAGNYVLHEYDVKSLQIDAFKLTLNFDGTYQFDGGAGIGLDTNGTWTTGGKHHKFEFNTHNGTELAIPSSNANDTTLSFKYNTGKGNHEFMQRILFVKK